MRQTSQPGSTGLLAYGAVTAAYWAFMLTDGALRMLVLLHFHTLGFSAVQLAYLFLLYEVAGVVTNLFAGWLAARFGLASTLYAGLVLQGAALVALAQLDPAWSLALSVGYVMAVQGLSGVAKDLAKMSSKSAVKLLAPQSQSGLFGWTAVLTGSKNAVKGLGFLLGAGLLAGVGFQLAVYSMAGVLAVILLAVLISAGRIGLSGPRAGGLPGADKTKALGDVLAKDPNISWLSLARVFLFGARDVWFVVGIPIYFYAVLSDGSAQGDRAAFFMIGGFMALWIIFYGFVQARAPKLLKAAERSPEALVGDARRLVAALILLPASLALSSLGLPAGPAFTALLVVGLLAFGALFAVNSSLHSYLILAFSKSERVTLDVGFYYSANAAGRLLGTLLSGLSYQAGGLAACLGTAALMLVLAWLATRRLQPAGAPL